MKSLIKTVFFLLAILSASTQASAQTPPPNDSRTNAIVLAGTNILAFGSTIDATSGAEDEKLSLSGNFLNRAGKSVWWIWTPPRSGSVVFDTFGSSFDTLLLVGLASQQGGSTSDDTTRVGSPLSSRVTRTVSAGVPLIVWVDGFAKAAGHIRLSIAYGAPPLITEQPGDLELGFGGTSSMTVKASGNNLRYQWEKDGVPISNAVNQLYRWSTVSTSSAGIYRMIVANEHGSVASSNIVVSVAPAVLTRQQTNLALGFGYRMLLGQVYSGQGGVLWNKNGDTTNSSLPFELVNPFSPFEPDRHAGVYQGRVSNSLGTIQLPPIRVETAPPWTFVVFAQLDTNASPHGIVRRSDGSFIVTDAYRNYVYEIDADGRIKPQWKYRTSGFGVCIDSNGSVVVAATQAHGIARLDPEKRPELIAGTSRMGYRDGPAMEAQFSYPADIVASPTGEFYVADSGNNLIRRIDTNGIVSTVAGKIWSPAGDYSNPAVFVDGPAPNALFNSPIGLALDPSGNLFIADEITHTIRKLSTNGVVSTVAGNRAYGFADGQVPYGQMYQPHGPAVGPDGSIYVADYLNHCVRQITKDGALFTIGGKPGQRGFNAGTGPYALFNGPRDLLHAPDGCLYVTDLGNHCIWKGIPAIVHLPTNSVERSVSFGEDLSLPSGAAGYGTLFHQWFKDGKPLDSSNSSTLSLGPVTNRQSSGQYSYVVSNAYFSATSPPISIKASIRQKFQPPERLPQGGLRLKFADESGEEPPADVLQKIQLQWRDWVSDDSELDWQTLDRPFFIQNGTIVVDLPVQETSTNRFFRLLEH